MVAGVTTGALIPPILQQSSRHLRHHAPQAKAWEIGWTPLDILVLVDNLTPQPNRRGRQADKDQHVHLSCALWLRKTADIKKHMESLVLVMHYSVLVLLVVALL